MHRFCQFSRRSSPSQAAIPYLMIGILATFGLLTISTPSYGSAIYKLTTVQASGESNTPQITLPKGHPITIDFSQSGETIRQVVLADRSWILARTDSPLCNGTNPKACKSGASKVFLSKLTKRVNFPVNERIGYWEKGDYISFLTITTTKGSERKSYDFKIAITGTNETLIKTYAIVSPEKALGSQAVPIRQQNLQQ